MKQLSRSLGRLLKPPPPRRPDPHRGARELAKRLAAEHAIELERLEGGWNVWPPKWLADDADPFNGDHYCDGWDEVLAAVSAYAAIAIARKVLA